MENSVDHLVNELKEEKRRNAILRTVSSYLNELTSLDEKLNNILELLDVSFNLKHTMILVPAKNNTVLRVLASRGFEEAGIGTEVPFNFGIVGVVAVKQKKLRVPRLSQYRRYAAAFHHSASTSPEVPDLPGLPNAESQVALPLISNNELVAVLSSESENIQFFHQSDEDFLMTISQQIALSIQNSIVYEQLEERVKLRTEELEKINATKDRLFSIIGHDLRSPVAALQGTAELFRYYNSKDKHEKMVELGNKITHAAKNINQLLDNLLNWSLSQKNEIRCLPENIVVYDLFNEVLQIFQDSIVSKAIRVVYLGNKKATVFADYNMMFSIFRNILSNAIKYTHEGDSIEVTTDDLGAQLKISIRDTGIGMNKEQLKRLFSLREQMSTLGTNREKGSGLGLILVHDFMQLNNGRIEIDSSDKGTSVHLLVPVQ